MVKVGSELQLLNGSMEMDTVKVKAIDRTSGEWIGVSVRGTEEDRWCGPLVEVRLFTSEFNGITSSFRRF